MKKLIIPAIIVILVLVGANAAYKYFFGPKIVDGAVSRSIDKNGKPVDETKVFAPEDEIYFSARGKRLLVKEGTVVWYKGEAKRPNRFKVQEDVKMNSSRYFSAKLSEPEGLEEGLYSVVIYAGNSDYIQVELQFEVKK
ncbi:MAG: hypothetical protein ACI33K_13775 [Clostridiaceae bacterium]